MSQLTNDTPSVTESTLQKLANSIQQQAATSLSSIQIPTFKGLPEEDVHDYLRRFKLATITLSDELRCLALQKSLSGAAHIWSRNNIKHDLTLGNWSEVKKALVERFSSPNRELRYQEKLAKLQFDPKTSTLLSYVEAYADCYRRAHGAVTDQVIIKALSLNLPHPILKNLNLLNDEWIGFDRLRHFNDLVKKLETKIIPYESTETISDDKKSLAELMKMIQELKEATQKRDQPKEDPKSDDQQALAAVRFQDNSGAQGSRNEGFRNNDFRQNYRDSGLNKPFYPRRDQQRYPRRGYQTFGPQRGSQFQYRSNNRNNEAHTNQQVSISNQKEDSSDLATAYEAKYGKVPSPCFTCKGNHFNRHCPYFDLN